MTSIDRTRRRTLLALGALGLGSIAPPALAQDAKSIAAQGAARTWLALADNLDAQASYDAADPKFKSAITVDRWADGLKQAREPFGAVDRRTVVNTRLTPTLPGFPSSDYAVVVFRSAFAKKPVVQETVTLDRDSAGAWHVVGYSLR